MAGTLYLVPTPIGNLGDISPRMADTLAQAAFIAAEDTRVTVKLLNHLGLKKPMVTYHRHNTAASGQAVLDRLLAGESCALVTDAGMPAISDPGRRWWPCVPLPGSRWYPSRVPAPWSRRWQPPASPPAASPLRAFWP